MVRWSNSFVHVKDDTGKEYLQWAQEQKSSFWNEDKQLTLVANRTIIIEPTLGNRNHYRDPDHFDVFRGAIKPSAKYLVVTIDQMWTMTEMNWRYDLQ